METYISLEKVTRSITYQTYNRSPGNYDLTTESYKHLSSELSPIFLDVYQFWEKPGTMGGSSRTGVISVIYKKGEIKYCKIQTHLTSKFRLENLNYNPEGFYPAWILPYATKWYVKMHMADSELSFPWTFSKLSTG